MSSPHFCPQISHNVEMPASGAVDAGRATDRCIDNMRVISALQRLSGGAVGQTFGNCRLAYGHCRHAEPNQVVSFWLASTITNTLA